MTAVAFLPVLTPATSLPDELVAAAVAELTSEIGRAPKPSDIARLHRLDNGMFVMSHRAPAVSRADLAELGDRPWGHPAGLRSTTSHGSIREVVAILLDPSSPDAEVRRREHLWEESQRQLRARQERDLAEQRSAGAAQVEEQRRQQRAAQEFRLKDWGPLPVESKALYALALAVDDGQDLATVLRHLAREIAGSGTVQFPARRWWA